MGQTIYFTNGSSITSLVNGNVVRSSKGEEYIKVIKLSQDDIFSMDKDSLVSMISPDLFKNNDITISWDYIDNQPIVKMIKKEKWDELFSNTDIDKRRKI